MTQYTQSIRKALENENWHAALMIALTMPDICGSIVNPKGNNYKRYENWFNKWMGEHYTKRMIKSLPTMLPNESTREYRKRIMEGKISFIPPEKEELESTEEYASRYKKLQEEYMLISNDYEDSIFLTASDCYLLRCSILHQGVTDITTQEKHKEYAKLNDFIFIAPKNNSVIHCNKMGEEGKELQLQVDIFCNQIADAVDEWMKTVEKNPEFKKRIDSLLKVY